MFIQTSYCLNKEICDLLTKRRAYRRCLKRSLRIFSLFSLVCSDMLLWNSTKTFSIILWRKSVIMSSICHQRSLLVTLCTTKHPHRLWHTVKRCSLIQSVHKWHKLITHSKHCCKSVNTSPDCCRTPSAVCSFPLTHTNVSTGVLVCLCNSPCLECFFPSVSYSLISVMHMSQTIVRNYFEKKTMNSY